MIFVSVYLMLFLNCVCSGVRVIFKTFQKIYQVYFRDCVPLGYYFHVSWKLCLDFKRGFQSLIGSFCMIFTNIFGVCLNWLMVIFSRLSPRYSTKAFLEPNGGYVWFFFFISSFGIFLSLVAPWMIFLKLFEKLNIYQ